MSSSSKSVEYYREHALTAYREGHEGIGAERVNNFLRSNHIQDNGNEIPIFTTHNKTMKKICAMIQSIDSKLLPTSKPIRVYRGISGDFYNSLRNTGVIVNKGYTSSSLSLEQAIAFSQGYERGVVLEFVIPSGMKIHKYGGAEQEVLIERNTQFVNFLEKSTIHNTLYVETIITKYSLPDKSALDSKIVEKNRSSSLKNEHVQQLLARLDDEDADDIDWLK